MKMLTADLISQVSKPAVAWFLGPQTSLWWYIYQKFLEQWVLLQAIQYVPRYNEIYHIWNFNSDSTAVCCFIDNPVLFS